MGPIESVKTCLRKCLVFSGRASPSEFWWFFLFLTIVASLPILGEMGFLVGILGIAAGWRRLQDTGRSGWWSLVPLLPTPVLLAGPDIVPGIVLASALLLIFALGCIVLVMQAMPGMEGANRYGPPPTS